MGHEYSGEVVEVGSDVTEFAPGDRVVEEPIHDCGECFQCKNGEQNVCRNFSITGMHRDGAWTEYTVATPSHLHPVPDGVSLRDAAVTEPASIATRAVFTQSETEPGNNVLVQGPGPIGYPTAKVADAMGANVLVSGLERDSEHRLPILEEAGIDTIDIENENLEEHREKMTNGGGFDIIFDTTGHKTGTEVAVEHARRGGQIVVVGLPGEASDVFMTPIVRGEIDINTSYGSTWTNSVPHKAR
jgi:L-iditol 2-dehydrogenase